MDKTIDQIDREISSAQRELDALIAQRKAIAALTDEQRLAIKLHRTLCQRDHTDQCGWEYEKEGTRHNWGGSVHRAWLDHAEKLTEIAGSLDHADGLVDLLGTW